MPDLGLSEIIGIISLIAGGASTAVGAVEANKGASNQKALLDAQQQQQAKQDLVRKQEALIASGPNAQAQTSGSLTGAAGTSFADLLAGYGGSGGSSGGSNPQGSTAVSGTSGGNPQAVIQQLLASNRNGGDFEGGNGNPATSPGFRFNLSQLNI